MKIKIFVIFILFNNIKSDIQSDLINTRPVSTENGAVIGSISIVNDQNVYSFKGIPFAKPPIGNLRFRPPEPANDWYETYDATYYRPSCWQPFPPGLGVPALSEDCLNLNIWTTTLDRSAKLPVMIYVVGGGFLIGSGAFTIFKYNLYGGAYLSLRNVVVVNFNYRLGSFGSLYGNSSEAPGNAAIWDQVMAINWTRRNIANFGGNPNDMTLFGQSAGGASIVGLMVSNTTYGIRNWFKKVILLSAANFIISQESAYKTARDYAKTQFNCINDRTWIECLKRIPEKLLFEADLAYDLSLASFAFKAIYGDTLRLIPYNPFYSLKHGYFRKDIHVLMNHNEMEGAFLGLISDILRDLGGRYSSFVKRPALISKSIVRDDVLNSLFVNCPFKQQVAQAFVMPFTRLGVKLNPQPIRRAIAFALGDYGVSCATVLYGSLMTQLPSFTGKVWQTRFTYQDKLSPLRSVWANSTHNEDLPSDFGLPLLIPELFSNDDTYISNKMMDLFTHFAKTGEVVLLNPTVYDDWPPYCVNNGVVNASYIELHADSNRLGRVFVNRYRGNDGYFPNAVYNCFNFWEQYLLNYEYCGI